MPTVQRAISEIVNTGADDEGDRTIAVISRAIISRSGRAGRAAVQYRRPRNSGRLHRRGLGWSANGGGRGHTLFGNMDAIDFSVSGNVDLTSGSSAWQGIATGVNDSGQISGTQYIGGQ